MCTMLYIYKCSYQLQGLGNLSFHKECLVNIIVPAIIGIFVIF